MAPGGLAVGGGGYGISVTWLSHVASVLRPMGTSWHPLAPALACPAHLGTGKASPPAPRKSFQSFQSIGKGITFTP